MFVVVRGLFFGISFKLNKNNNNNKIVYGLWIHRIDYFKLFHVRYSFGSYDNRHILRVFFFLIFTTRNIMLLILLLFLMIPF